MLEQNTLSTMEVTILDAANLPPQAVLVINTGSIRGQVKLQVNQPFVLTSPDSSSAVEVSLFQQIATQHMVDEGKNKAHCSIPFQRADGVDSQVELQIRREQQASNGTTHCPPNKDMVGVVTGYLSKHKLTEKFENLIQDVLQEQPDDPFKCMLDALKRARSVDATTIVARDTCEQEKMGKNACSKANGCDTASATLPRQPLIPRPPEGPPPARKRRPPDGLHKAAGTSICTGCPCEKKVSVAKVVITHVMHSPSVQKAAQESVREVVRKEVSHALATKILASARARVEVNKMGLDNVGMVAQDTNCHTLENCSSCTSNQYLKALARFSVSMLLRGAASAMASQEHLQEANLSLEEGRERSVPAPIGHSVESGSIFTSSGYLQALSRFSVNMLFRGAALAVASHEQLLEKQVREAGRRKSLPAPIVSLHAERSWGQWLTPRSK